MNIKDPDKNPASGCSKGVEEVIVFYDKKHNISSINSQAQGLLFISITA